jgi:hypothetical protein
MFLLIAYLYNSVYYCTVVTMYYDDCTYKHGQRTYHRDLLRESHRVNGKVVKKTIANITDWPSPVKAAIRQALADGRVGVKGQANAGSQTESLVTLLADHRGQRPVQGKAIGAVATILTLAERLGITAALGDDRQGRLALLQVIARVLDQGSRLSAVRLAHSHLLAELLRVPHFNEDDLYDNLDWLAAQQATIEDRLFTAAYPTLQRPNLFLYDVTSSYFEGTDNELAAFGYNRDGKKGKKQVVAGLLTDQQGTPWSIELFPGNTADPSTVPSQLSKLRTRFGGGELTLVGDRGMLKVPQQRALGELGMHYLTAITKAQIMGLLRQGTIQLELFEQELAEVTEADAGKRYILRRNPAQAERVCRRRKDQLATWRRFLASTNDYLKAHPRASLEAATRRVTGRAVRLKLADFLQVIAQEGQLHEQLDEAAMAVASELDGCYVLCTDLGPSVASKETLDARYHDLAKVEWAFRSCKTAHLEMRPIYLRNEARTRAHALVVMLAYRLRQQLAEHWVGLDSTVQNGLDKLSQLCVQGVKVPGGAMIWETPVPRDDIQALLTAAAIKLPTLIPPPDHTVDTTRKLPSRRKLRKK